MNMSRISRQLVRFVLLLYLATLGVAMAAPFMHTQATDLVCTSAGYKLVGQQDNVKSDGAGGASHLLDCALCLASGIIPSFPRLDAPAERHVLSYALRSIPAARLASVVSAPLPARGPPELS
jgi:hypothetical protein